MVSLDDARIIKYEQDKEEFELFVDPDLAFEIRDGKKKYEEVKNNLFAIETIFKDAKKGDKADEKSIIKIFGTDNFDKVALEIILKGKLNLTTEQKRKILEQRKKELINYIVRNSINPLMKLPHPPQRVENAIEKAKIEIDINKPLSKQLDKIIEKLNPILPMHFQKSKYKLTIPLAFAGKINGIIKKYDVLERKWTNNAFVCVVEVPIGLKDNFMKTISSITQGKALIEIE
jgi:ribosome maturation protein SDO1